MIEVTFEDENDEITTVHADEANITPRERYLQIRIAADEHQIDIPTRRVITVERDLDGVGEDERTASAQYL
ncbi:hypothetical protein [Halalkalicoccus jeotgali]|uniref:Uncharacterized protein n=1 Tax=Halalkalicoccus jeotgali (strain DSM 18796 / CECT 7217 / JCM 14584 / KCTC 4019 / B3) TaxID=795797 RepID=D8JBE4_HALJB|nr:hypothetical protein [Halalkalicoccus jeotgali]ADJ16597.1 hypothetical protein HacjB3_16196 [Halalkalicoccus jeotgali B3]ELY41306.1 hypothetical protein C497_01050 [Halalkalicoccus jeotgali B3]